MYNYWSSFYIRLEICTPRSWIMSLSRYKVQQHRKRLNGALARDMVETSIGLHYENSTADKEICSDYVDVKRVRRYETKSKYQDKLIHAYRRKITKLMSRIDILENEQEQVRVIMHIDKGGL